MNRFAWFTAVATFFLIIAGASVTSTGSGLAVPDWPLSFGQFFPPMKGPIHDGRGVFFEHGHRMIAGTVGILTSILMAWLWLKEKRRWLCWLGTAAFAIVMLQALLGGITVLYGLPQKISIAHAILAQTFFCLTVALALFTSPKWRMEGIGRTQDPRLTTHSLILLFLIFVQLILGAVFRHGAVFSFLYVHIALALGLWLMSFLIVRAEKNVETDNSFLKKFRAALFILISIQILVGIASALPKFGAGPFWFAASSVWITILHVGLGALILANSLVITLWSYRIEWENKRMNIERMSKTHDPRLIFASPSLR